MDNSKSAQATRGDAYVIHQLFEAQVQRSPSAVAVLHEGNSLTYTELNARANQLARFLVNEGVCPDQPVGICTGRTLQMIIGLLAIMKAGGAYLPLDPSYPPERLKLMLEDASAPVVLVHEGLKALLPQSSSRLIVLDLRIREICDYVSEDLAPEEVGVNGSSLVYVIYTSGSTGRPKGIAMTHRSMVNLIEWHRASFNTPLGHRVLQFAALSFDVAFQEIFSTLCTGGTLVLLEEWIRRDTHALAQLLDGRGIERLFLPPVMLQSLSEFFATTSTPPPRSLRDIITAGEQLRISPQVVSLFNQLDGCRLHNHYGPSETHVVTALTLPDDAQQWPVLPSIGYAIANTRIHILDDQRHPVACGTVGEIYIGGAALARDYLGKPELTAQRFTIDPFSTDPEARLYKTGDLGRVRLDGSVEYLGRNDEQVKVRGFRIELGEIETQLTHHPRVKDAVVVMRGDAQGDPRLVGYITSRDSSNLDRFELHAHLSAVLPQYMVPAAFVLLDQLPLTPNGKIDRRSLPAPPPQAYLHAQYEAPQGQSETVLARIWEDLLHVPRVGRQDSFISLGGHSLLIVRLLERLRQVGLTAPAHSVFENPTLAQLASVLTNTVRPLGQVGLNLIPSQGPSFIPPQCETITPQMLTSVCLTPTEIEQIVHLTPGGAANIQDIYPLAPMQEGMLFHHLLSLGEGGDTYVLPMLLSLSSQHKLEQFATALQKVIDRHDILRTAIIWDRLSKPVQVVSRRVMLPVEELTFAAHSEPETQLAHWMSSERQTLDLSRPPLIRLQAVADADGVRYHAILKIHHVICDHDSLETLFREVAACMAGRGTELPRPFQYREHVINALNSDGTHAAESFFRQKLGNVEEPTAPFGIFEIRGAVKAMSLARQEVDSALSQRVRSAARRHGVSAATLFHAAWSLVVAHTSGRDDIVFGTLLLGRLQGVDEQGPALGMFMNTLPLRLSLQGATAVDLVEQVHRELVGLLKHEHASLGQAQRCSAIPGTAPLFTALFNYRHSNASSRSTSTEITAGVELVDLREWTNYPLTATVDDFGNEFLLSAKTAPPIAPDRVLTYLLTGLRSLLGALESTPEEAALQLPVLPEAERNQLMLGFSGAGQQQGHPALVHKLFEATVQANPRTPAVIYNGDSLTYFELNARANRLAHYLREKGVGPDQLVGLCVERSLDMVVGILAILKAGGAYVPLDPAYPAEHLRYILSDAKPALVLTQARLRTDFPKTDIEVLALDTDWPTISARSSDDLDSDISGPRPEHLVYVIYTSGSTGRPKGVMIEHRNLVSLWRALEPLYQDASPIQRVAVNASFNFDASVKQLIQLLSGRTLILVPEQSRGDPEELRDFVCRSDVHAIDCTPSQLRTWTTTSLLDSRCPLRLVLVGGEPIDAAQWKDLARISKVRFYNVYGPTESTVDATAARVSPSAVPHIGRPLAHRSLYILDRAGHPAPVGVTGEIHLGGEGIARGYLNRPDLTENRFIPNPFHDLPTGRLYRTGDMARWLPDGTVEYLGRNDHQTKIRGYRVELGEIEAQLTRYRLVEECVVIVREDTPADQRLVAYVIPRGTEQPSTQELRAHLTSVLPEHMIPGAFVTLEKFPLTPNGKLNRRALPPPDAGSYVQRTYESPRGDIEIALTRIWSDVLRLDHIGRQDNFFELGGHSVLAMQVIARIRSQLSIRLSLKAMFDYATVSELSTHVATLGGTRPLHDFDTADTDLHELLEEVAGMSEDAVAELVLQLRAEARP